MEDEFKDMIERWAEVIRRKRPEPEQPGVAGLSWAEQVAIELLLKRMNQLGAIHQTLRSADPTGVDARYVATCTGAYTVMLEFVTLLGSLREKMQ